MSFDLLLIAQVLPQPLEGLWLTMLLLGLSLAGGACLAVPTVWALLCGHRIGRARVQIDVWMFRGTPALVQLFVIYYGLSQFVWLRETAA